MDDKYIVAIEIGSSKIRGALASIDPRGVLNILAVQDERTVDSVRYGHVKNVEEVSTKVDSICRKLENSREIQPRKITSVYVGLSGCTIGATTATETSHFDVDTEIDAMSIERLKGFISTIGNSDKDIYEMLPREFLVDNESTLNPVGRIGSSITGTFSLIGGAPSIKNNLNRVFPERLSLQVNGYIVTALAQADIVLTPDEKQLGCMFVDFGSDTTTIIIFKKGVLRYMVTLPMGSRNITRDLVSLNHLEEHAESLKRSVGIFNQTDGAIGGQHSLDKPELYSYISARAGEIVANVIANIEYAGFTPADLPSGIVMVGGGAKLKGLDDMIASQSNMKVRHGSTPRNLRISDMSIAADDIVDIAALLVAAASRNPAECISPIADIDSDAGQHASPSQIGPNNNDGHYDGDYDDGDGDEVRIGREDDDDILDDVDFIDKPKSKGHGKHDLKNPKNPKKPQDTRSLIDKIQARMKGLFSDNEEDRFNDDDYEDDDDR
ncbi:MAG: cell division FtsA domain-containing protein [Bacteroidales bacterium]|nr:cell division FtsA domain-containing protein [Bacteroidales bacterium]